MKPQRAFHMLSSHRRPDRAAARGRSIANAMIVAACLAAASAPQSRARCADTTDGLAASGLTMIPADAVYASAWLRLREQYERLRSSKAVASLMTLPTVEKLSTATAPALSGLQMLLGLSENQQAVELLADMAAHDAFVYGGDSWLKIADFMNRVTQNRDADRLVADIAGKDDEPLSSAIRAVARHRHLLVVPDTVWGFKTTMHDAARAQLIRIEALAREVAQQRPESGLRIGSRLVHGADLLTLTLPGKALPWEQWAEEADDLDTDEIGRIIERLKTLDLVVAIGLVGDHVIVSFGGSTDLVERLVVGDAAGPALVATPAFAALRADAALPLTGVTYTSEALVRRLQPTPDDAEDMRAFVRKAAEAAGMPQDRLSELLEMCETGATLCHNTRAVPGATMSYSYLTDRGYAGHTWDWTRPQLDGSTRLAILDHAGGRPLAVVASRIRLDPGCFDEVVRWTGASWPSMKRQIAHGMQNGDLPPFDLPTFDRIVDSATPSLEKLVGVIREHIVPAIAGEEYALVIDAADSTRRLHEELPASAEPLPLLAPAAIFAVRDVAGIRASLEALLPILDQLTTAFAPAVEIRLPRPEKSATPVGEVWTFPVPEFGLDGRIAPTIAFGEKVVVFSLVGSQARRLVESTPLKGAGAGFDMPLAAAAVFDSAGTVAAVEPWIDYVIRCQCVARRGDTVDGRLTVSAADHTEESKGVLAEMTTVLRALQSLRVVTAATEVRPDATVTHWHNAIEDIPGPPGRPAATAESPADTK